MKSIAQVVYRRLRATVSFSPLKLFSAGEQGVWYDPSDMTTLFQDDNGFTPVTAVEQSVGMVLDKSQGLILGAELISNGTFDANITGWSSQANSTISWVSGELRAVASAGNTSGVWQDLTTVAGRTYRLTMTVRQNTGNVQLFAFNGAFATQLKVATVTAPVANTTVSMHFTAIGTTTRVGFAPLAAATAFADNISLKHVPGNHATQTTSGSRPVLSARYNLLTKTEQFNDAAWIKSQTGVTANTTATTDPLGGNTADFVYDTVATDRHILYTASVGFASTETFRISAKPAGRRYLALAHHSTLPSFLDAVYYDLQDGVVTSTPSGVTATAIKDATTGWVTCTFTRTVAGTPGAVVISLSDRSGPTGSLAFGSPSYAGDGTSGVYLWGADLRATNDAANVPLYQRVDTATSYDTTDFPMYLQFDGTDDGLFTGSVDFTGTDAVTIWAGVRKLSDSGRGSVVELTSTIASNNGAFHLTAPNATSATYGFESKGTTLRDAVASGVAAPTTDILCAYSDISSDQAILRVDGVQADSDTGDQGTGNYSNAVLYIGRRNSASIPFTGRIYGLIIRGAASTTSQITGGEKWMNGKTKAYA